MIGLGTRDRDEHINEMLGATMKEECCWKLRAGQDELSLAESGEGLAEKLAQKLHIS